MSTDVQQILTWQTTLKQVTAAKHAAGMRARLDAQTYCRNVRILHIVIAALVLIAAFWKLIPTAVVLPALALILFSASRLGALPPLPLDPNIALLCNARLEIEKNEMDKNKTLLAMCKTLQEQTRNKQLSASQLLRIYARWADQQPPAPIQRKTEVTEVKINKQKADTTETTNK